MNPEITPVTPNRRPLLIVSAISLVAVIVIVIALVARQNGMPAGSAAGTNDPAKTGCPAKSANVNWPQAANVIIHISATNSTTAVHTGDTVEVNLPAGYIWNLLAIDAAYMTLIAPGGAYASTTNMCVWHFTAQTTGTTIFYFTRHMLCQPGKLCSDLTIRYGFVVTITTA